MLATTLQTFLLCLCSFFPWELFDSALFFKFKLFLTPHTNMVELESNLLEKCSRKCLVFEDHRKSLIYHCKLSLHFEWPKIDLKCPKYSIFGEFFVNLKLMVKQCYQTGHFWIRQKLMENAKIEKLKCDFLGDFHTL